MCHERGIISFSSLLFCFRSADFFSVGLFTLGAWEPLPGYRHKTVLCSHFEYPILCDCVHSYALSDSILKHELSSENKAVDCPELTKIVCTEGSGTHFCAQILSWVPEKKGVLTLVPSEYRTWADRARATSAVKDAKLIDLLTYYVILGPHTLLSLIIIKILCVFFSLLFSVIQNWKRLFHHVLNIFT